MRLPKPVISTWEGLKELGFIDVVDDQLAELIPMRSYRLGKLKLRASLTVTWYMAQIVVLHAEYFSARSFGMVDDEYPLKVESLDQLAAFVADTARKVMDEEDIDGPLPLWFQHGLQNKHLLPEQQAIAEYEARPHCWAEREWVKLALKSLEKHLTQIDDETAVAFSFDGSLLTIRCGDHVSPIPAVGKAWPTTYTLAAKHLRRLPGRLRRNRSVHVGVWEDSLEISMHRFAPIVPRYTPEPTPQQQA